MDILAEIRLITKEMEKLYEGTDRSFEMAYTNWIQMMEEKIYDVENMTKVELQTFIRKSLDPPFEQLAEVVYKIENDKLNNLFDKNVSKEYDKFLVNMINLNKSKSTSDLNKALNNIKNLKNTKTNIMSMLRKS